MPGPWIERTSQAQEVVTEWYETQLKPNTKYEIQVGLQEDYSDAADAEFTTLRTVNSVELALVRVIPEGGLPTEISDADWTREPYGHEFEVSVDKPRYARIAAAAVSGSAKIEVLQEDRTTPLGRVLLEAGSVVIAYIRVTNGSNSRLYIITFRFVVPVTTEFDLSEITSITSRTAFLRDITANDTYMYVSLNNRVYQIDRAVKQLIRSIPARQAAVAWNEDTLWINRVAYDENLSRKQIPNARTTGSGVAFDWINGNLVYNQRGIWRDDETGRVFRGNGRTFVTPSRNNIAALIVTDTDGTTVDQTETDRYNAAWANIVDGLGQPAAGGATGLWGDSEHLFIGWFGGTPRQYHIAAINRLTYLREVATGAVFDGPQDIPMRESGVLNAFGLWGNSTTLWAGNNAFVDRQFTGNVTRLIAFNRSTRRADPAKDIDIASVVSQGRDVTGNSKNLWVLGDARAYAWTLNGRRDSSKDLTLFSGVTSIHATDDLMLAVNDRGNWNQYWIGPTPTTVGAQNFQRYGEASIERRDDFSPISNPSMGANQYEKAMSDNIIIRRNAEVEVYRGGVYEQIQQERRWIVNYTATPDQTPGGTIIVQPPPDDPTTPEPRDPVDPTPDPEPPPPPPEPDPEPEPPPPPPPAPDPDPPPPAPDPAPRRPQISVRGGRRQVTLTITRASGQRYEFRVWNSTSRTWTGWRTTGATQTLRVGDNVTVAFQVRTRTSNSAWSSVAEARAVSLRPQPPAIPPSRTPTVSAAVNNRHTVSVNVGTRIGEQLQFRYTYAGVAWTSFTNSRGTISITGVPPGTRVTIQARYRRTSDNVSGPTRTYQANTPRQRQFIEETYFLCTEYRFTFTVRVVSDKARYNASLRQLRTYESEQDPSNITDVGLMILQGLVRSSGGLAEVLSQQFGKLINEVQGELANDILLTRTNIVTFDLQLTIALLGGQAVTINPIRRTFTFILCVQRTRRVEVS